MKTGGDSKDDKELDGLFQDKTSKDADKAIDLRLWFKNHWGVVACLGSGLFAGLVPATSRYVQDRGYTAYQLNFFNDLLLVSAVLCVAICHRTNLRLPNNHGKVIRLILNGVGRFFAILCQISAYRYAPPANAEMVLSPGLIVFVVILSCIFIQEMPTRMTMFGSLWCIAGVSLLGYSATINKSPSTVNNDGVVLGIVLAIGAALLHAMLNINVKMLMESTSKTMILTYTYGIATIVSGLTTIFTSETWYLEPTAAAVLFANCASRGTGIVLRYAGLKLVEINAVTALLQSNAFSAYGLQWALLGFVPTIFDGFGLTCIFIGTFSVAIWQALVRRRKDRHVELMKLLDLNVTQPNNDK